MFKGYDDIPVYEHAYRDASRHLWPHMDSVQAAIVVADDVDQARTLMAARALDEGKDVWPAPRHSSCLPIDLVTPRVVLTQGSRSQESPASRPEARRHAAAVPR